MDRVRFGRVLGRGARMAARTVVEAVDAATTPAVTSSTTKTSTATTSTPTGAQATAARQANSSSRPAPSVASKPPLANRKVVGRAVRTASHVQGTARAARRGVLDPVKRASRAVTLEISGSFFALFALSFAAAAWKHRSLATSGEGERLWIYLGFAALFGYFAVSNFVRARRLSNF